MHPTGGFNVPVRLRASHIVIAVIAGAAAAAVTGGALPLDAPARTTALIFIAAAAAWAADVVSPTAVGIAAMAASAWLVGLPAGPAVWHRMLETIGNPAMWILIGGFFLAAAVEKAGVPDGLARALARRTGGRPAPYFAAVVGTTFCLSAFLSNTATTIVMLAVGLAGTRPDAAAFRRALIVAVPVAANLGGMATLVGTPPNALAAAAAHDRANVGFAAFSAAGVPTGLLLLLIAAAILHRRLPRDAAAVQPHPPAAAALDPLRTNIALGGAAATVLLWLTGDVLGLPAPLAALVPVALFSLAGVVNDDDIQRMPWDTMLLIGGGMALGTAVETTGLGTAVARALVPAGASPFVIAVVVAYLTTLLANVMAHTAAAALMLPIALAAVPERPAAAAVTCALAASCAMFLPGSTPPNALAYATGEIKAADFYGPAAVPTLIGPPLAATLAFAAFS